MVYEALQLLHVLAATVWVGGHLIIALSYLPEAVRRGNIGIFLEFEKRYGAKLGVPSLLVAGITGLAMAHSYTGWFSATWPIGIKIVLFAVIVLNMVIARRELHKSIGTSSNPSLMRLAVHIVIVTAASILLVIMGWTLRMGIY